MSGLKWVVQQSGVVGEVGEPKACNTLHSSVDNQESSVGESYREN